MTTFEIKRYKKTLTIPWKEKVTNEEVLRRIDMDTPLLLLNIKKQKLRYFGYIIRHISLENHILEAKIEGKRRRGRLTRRWENDTANWMKIGDSVLCLKKVRGAKSKQKICYR